MSMPYQPSIIQLPLPVGGFGFFGSSHLISKTSKVSLYLGVVNPYSLKLGVCQGYCLHLNRTLKCKTLNLVALLDADSQIAGSYCQCIDPDKRYERFDIGRDHNLLNLNRSLRSGIVRSGTSDVASPFPEEASLGPKFRGVCFYAVTATVAIFLFVLMVVSHPFVLLLDRYRRRAHYFVANTWATLTILPFFKVEFEGLEHLPSSETPAVYVSNHQSFLDIYTLLTLGRSFKFISKTSIFLYPIIGWAMYLMGVIPLKRMDSRSQLDCLKRCMDLIRGGASVFFFPEGTRSKDGKLAAFKRGAFSVAAKTQVPVVPMTIIGTGSIMPAGKEGLLYPGSVKVVIHPFLTGNDAQVLCDQARTAIAFTLGQQG